MLLYIIEIFDWNIQVNTVGETTLFYSSFESINKCLIVLYFVGY